MSDSTALTDRLNRLEAENAALADAVALSSGGWWRAAVSALCIVVAAMLVPVSIVGAWARVQLVDEDAFVSTLAPLADYPAVQGMVIDETVSAVRAQVDFGQVTDTVFDGISQLGMSARATAALDLLRRPAAAGLDNLVSSAVTRVVESPAFSEIWTTALRGTHRTLTQVSTSDGGGVVVLTPDGLGIALGPLVADLKGALVDQDVGVAFLIPTVERTIIVGSGDNLLAIRAGYRIVDAMGWWLPVITLAIFALGIAVARRRSKAVVGAGLGIALAAGSLGAVLSMGSLAVGMAANELGLSPTAIDEIYSQLIDDMRRTASIFLLLGVVIAVVGWLSGRSRPARAVRAAVDSLNSSARRSLAARGLDTAGFGSWLDRHRVTVRVLIGVLAVVWLFSLRPLAVSDILLVIVTSLVVGWVLELLQKRPVVQ